MRRVMEVAALQHPDRLKNKIQSKRKIKILCPHKEDAIQYALIILEQGKKEKILTTPVLQVRKKVKA